MIHRVQHSTALLLSASMLSLAVGCGSLMGPGTMERDLARVTTDMDRVNQATAETQKLVETRLQALETRQKTDSELILHNLAGLEQRIAALQETLDAMRTQVEEMRYRTTGQTPDRVSIAVGQGDRASTVVLEGDQLFLDGQKALQRNDYAAARASFQEFLKQFPTSPNRAEAQLWIGQCYFREKKYPEAKAAFQVVERQYVSSPRVPDSLMWTALCEEQQGQPRQAVATLERLITNYPKWDRIENAQEMLKRLVKLESQVPPALPR